MKFKKFIKKNSSTIIGISVFVLVIVAILLIKNVFMFDESQAVYGSRTEGIDKVKVSSGQKKQVQEKLSSAKSASVRVAGKIVNIIITANDETSLEDAKKLGDTSLEVFTDKQKQFYDFQVFVENDSNKNQFPIIGYKQHTKDKLTWTKDRVGN